MLTSLWQVWVDLWQWSLQHPEIAVSITTGGLGFLGWLATRMPKIWRYFQRRRKPQPLPPRDTFPFTVIAPKTPEVMGQLWPNPQNPNDVLADINIPYQPTREGQDVQIALENLLKTGKHSVLILGPTGRGKTREAAQLAGQLNQEGWTILKLKNNDWLDVPTRFEADRLGYQPALLFFLDDLNQAIFLGGNLAPVAENLTISDPLKVPFQERLVKTLQFYQNACGNRVRVIATARNETEPDIAGSPSPAEVLNFSQFPDFRNCFECYELPKPDVADIETILADRTQSAQIAVDAAEIPQIARKSDRNYRNIIEQLRQAQSRDRPLSLATFAETLTGTWQERYRAAVRQYPLASYVYDAVDLLRQVKVELNKPTVLATARMLLTHKPSLNLWRIWQLRTTLNALIHFEGILTPADGQIEAKRIEQLKIEPYLPKLLKILQRLTEQDPALYLPSLSELGLFAYQGGRYELALAVFDQVLQYKPAEGEIWFYQGNALSFLGRKQAAIDSYDQALHFKPDYHEAWNNRGTALSALGRQQAAIDSYDQALHFKPDYHEAWNNRGTALYALGRMQDTIDSYDQALHFKPDYHEAWYNRGFALADLGRQQDAIDSYDQALHFKPDKHEAWYNRGNALSALGRQQAAIDSYDQALRFKPDYHQAWYNKACIHSLQKETELAIEALSRAIELDSECREMAQTNSIFDAIRDDKRFQQLLADS